MLEHLPKKWVGMIAESLDQKAAPSVDWNQVKRRHRRKLFQRSLAGLGGIAAAAILTWGLGLMIKHPQTPYAFEVTAEWYSDSLSSTYADLDNIFAMTVAMMDEE